MKFNWLFTLSVCISVGVVMTSMYAGFESVKVSYTQQIADLQTELKEAKAKIKTLEDLPNERVEKMMRKVMKDG